MALVRATIIIATMLWAVAEVLKLLRPDRVEPARQLWTTAVALAVLHAAAAFQSVYDWNQAIAIEATARQTQALVGLAWGGGVFVNYAFLTAWAADAIWWWIAPASYRLRPAIVETTRLWIFVFMFVNGAIVFAGGVARIAGIAAVGAVCLAWALPRPARRAATEPSTTLHV